MSTGRAGRGADGLREHPLNALPVCLCPCARETRRIARTGIGLYELDAQAVSSRTGA